MLFNKKGEQMIHKRLKALLFSAGLIVSPLSIMAVDWVPVGDCVREVNGIKYAYTKSSFNEPCQNYTGGDRISDTDLFRNSKSTTTREALHRNTSFTATTSTKTLNIYGKLNSFGAACPLKVDGDVLLTAEAADMTVNIASSVVIMPYVDPTGDDFGQNGSNTGLGYAQIYFKAGENRTITVNVEHDLEFRGRTLGVTTLKKSGLESKLKTLTRTSGEGESACDNQEALDMILTFAGKGKTIFKMADGTTVSFLGDMDTCNPVKICEGGTIDGVSNKAGGTKVYVTMEQTQDDIACFKDKVTFQRSSLDSTNSYGNDSRVGIVIGHNSIFTFLSTDATGVAHEADSSVGNFASVAFDPSNNGQGRMALFILGAYTFGFDTDTFTTSDPGYLAINEKYPFNEGSFIVAGHRVRNFTPAGIRTKLNYSEPAGGQAIVRVTDDLFYANRDTSVAYDPQKRRGLLVINDCQSVSKRASDPYLDFLNSPDVLSRSLKKEAPTKMIKGRAAVSKKHVTKDCCDFTSSSFDCFAQEEGGPKYLYGYDWSYSKGLNIPGASYTRNVRNGFVVGINGVLDVNHNCFLDYVAGSINQADLLAVNDYTNNNVDAKKLIKGKNPAALVIDGLDTTLYVQGLSSFEAGNPLLRDRPINARINLRGDATLLMRAAGSSSVGYMYNFWSPLIPSLFRHVDEKGKVTMLRESSVSKGIFDGNNGETDSGFGENPRANTSNPVFNPYTDFQSALLTGSGEYNGFGVVNSDSSTRSISRSGGNDLNAPGVTERCCDGSMGVVRSGEGQHVIEFEGKCTFWSYPNTSILDGNNSCAERDYASTVAQAGVVNMPTIVIDYTGNEIDSRPLSTNNTYEVYNSPAMFLNDHVHFVSTNLVHSDITKLVDGNPAQSEPAIVGGERLYFASRFFNFDQDSLTDRDRWRLPELQLYSSTLHLFESLCSSGVRFVVKDRPVLLADGRYSQIDSDTPDVKGQAGNNTSVVRFYDHGNALDSDFTGYGRILQQGSLHNTMADGHTTTWSTQDAYWNVFKSNAPSENVDDSSASVLLELRNGDQFPDSVQPSGLSVDDQYASQRAHHLFLNSVLEEGGTNVAIGWPVESAQFARSRSMNNAYPYMNTVYPLNYDAQESISTNPSDLFSLDAFQVPPATVAIKGNYICWGGFNDNGESVLTPVNRDNNQGVVYVNHGGELTITRPNDDNVESQPYVTVVDTVIAQKISNDYNLAGDTRVQQLTGIVDLPHDQSVYAKGAGVQPYGFTQAMFAERSFDTAGYVRMSFDNPSRSVGDRSGANEVLVNWFNREGNNTFFQPYPTRTPANWLSNIKPKQTRAIETVKVPVVKPAHLLYIGTNDDVRQMKVAGATMSDPLVLEVSGDEVLPIPGRVREFVSLPRSQDLPGGDHMVGEGDHARLYLDFGGRIGLGNAAYNEQSEKAWTRLGKDYVQILPLGDGVIDVNSDLLIADRQALVATTSFSQDTGAGTDDDPIVHHENRITFFSDTPREIRIPAGGELDLSSFGQAPGTQQICFGGKISLIFEEGSTLRFPSVDAAIVRDVNGDPVLGGGEGEQGTREAAPVALYMNDEAQIIFEGQIETQKVTQPFVLASNANQQRIKILGKGQIWLDKNAKMNIIRTGSVGIETDDQTPQTDIVISLHRQSQFNIGTEVLEGGSFQVGNITDKGDGQFINFKLQHIFGGNPRTHIDRQGFFGIGAGVIDKHELVNGSATRENNPVMNGNVAELDGDGFPVFTPSTEPADGWTIQALHNVNNVSISLLAGRFEHNNIADGSDPSASLFALGPAASWDLAINGPTRVQVLGGGNMMKVPAGIDGLFANVWDYASPLSNGEQYSLMPSAPMLFRRTDAASYTLYNQPEKNIEAGVRFTVDTLDDFFDIMSCNAIGNQDLMLATLGTGNFVYTAGFVNLNNNPADIYPADSLKIVRDTSPVLLPQGNIALGLAAGTLNANGLDKPRDPISFALYLTT